MAGNSIQPITGGTQPEHSNGNVALERSPVTENLYPQNREWLGNLTNAQTDVNSPATTEETFWITKTTDAKELSRRLLEENFGFSKEDYAAYVKKYGELVISDERRCESAKTGNLSEKDAKAACSWASATDITNWKTVGGKVPVDLKAETVRQIQNFKQERTIDEAVGKIVDPFLRETVKNDLMTLATGDGQARIDAAARLQNQEADTFDDIEAVRNSIRTLAAQPLNRQNAAMQILSAKIDLSKAVADKRRAVEMFKNSGGDTKNVYNQEAWRKVFDYEHQLQRVADAASGFDTQTGQRLPNAKINRAEAAWANQQLSELYSALGETDKAAEREMMSRYYQIDEKERSNFWKPSVSMDGSILGGGYFPRNKGNVMKPADGSIPPTQSEQTQTKDPNETPYRFEYKVTDKVDEQGKIVRDEQTKKVKVVERTYQIEGSLKTADKMQVSTYEYFDEKGNRVRQGLPYKIRNERRTTIPPPELNTKGTTRAFRAAGGVGAIQEFNNWFPIVVDVLITNKSLNARLAREAAEKQAFLDNNYPIPVEPKDLPKIKLRLEQVYGKEKAAIIMKKVEEMSYAAYGSQ